MSCTTCSWLESGLARQLWLSFIRDPIEYSVRLHVDPGPGPLLVLHYEPLEYENNNTSKHAALLDCASDAFSEEEVGLPCPSLRRYVCKLTGSHISRFCCLMRVQLLRLNGTLAQPDGRHVQDLGALIPMRTTRNVRSSCEPLYKISPCPPLCKPVSTT
jgi:hypothetical protein